jgi:hypothetical protein
MMRTITKLNFFAIILILFPVMCFAQYPSNIPAKLKIAESLASGNWNDRTIWSNDKLPGDSTFIIIHSGHTITMTADATCESLVIEPEATLNNGGFDLTIHFMGNAHGVSAHEVDDGVAYYGYAPIDATWTIYNPNNGNWNIYKVDGLHTGAGHTLFNSHYADPNDLGFTFTGNGVISTGPIFYIGMRSNGAKFNSACTMEIYADLNLIDILDQSAGGEMTTANNFGNIILKDGAGFIGAAGNGTFNNKPGGYIKIEGGTLKIGPVGVGYTPAMFFNDGIVEVLAGNMEIPSNSFYANNYQTTVTGNILGTDSESPFCFFYQGAEGAILTIGGAIFPSENPGTLTCYYAEPNYVIYSGDANQVVIAPTEIYDPETLTPYSNLVISNQNAIASIATDITVNGDLTIKPESALTVQSGSSLTVGGSFTIESDATGTGSFISSTAISGNVQRYIAGHNGNANDGWHLLSSPVAAQAISDFHTAGSGNDFYKWDEPTNLWINRTEEGGGLNGSFETNFEVGKGYLVANTTSGTNTFTGSINASNANISSLSYTGANTYVGWHLLGNPFSSALIWNNGNWLLNNVDANAQIWNESTGSYTIIAANDIVPASNGFMVHASANSASLTIPAAARTHDASGWYKNADQTNRIILTAIDDEGGTEQSSIIRFDANATDGYDSQYDSYFLSGFAPIFYSGNQEENYALNTLPELSSGLTIPMGFVKNAGSQFTIELTENIPGQAVYLTDLKANETTNLAESSYTFSAQDGDNVNRFLLHFGTLGIDKPATDHNTIAWVYDKQLYLLNAGPAEAFIYDLQGRMLQSYRIESSDLQSLSVNLSAGVYVIRMQGASEFRSVKIIVQ